jgi:rhodanese-related sulfurtransferase
MFEAGSCTAKLKSLFWLLGAFYLVFWPGGAAVADAEIDGSALAAVHQWVAIRHRGVKHLSAADMDKLRIRASEDFLLIDVRTAPEYAVSHLGNAVRVAPSIKTDDFMREFGTKLKGRTLVLYCSVGERSSRLAARIQQAGMAAGATAVYNLTGGIFNWHNQSRQLVNENGATKLVHPYSDTWSRLLLNQKLTSYAAGKPPKAAAD